MVVQNYGYSPLCKCKLFPHPDIASTKLSQYKARPGCVLQNMFKSSREF